jgi:queuosine precursor transporter
MPTVKESSRPFSITRYSFRFVAIAALFVTCLLIANIVAVKLIELPGGIIAPAGVVIFPLSYLFGDVLTEVYGYAAARRVIWLGFFCNLVAVIAIAVAGALPPAPFWQGQVAYETILGFTPYLLIASFCAYLVGEFLNSFVLARMKVATNGRWLWTRTIGSTLIGEGADTVIFISLAFGATGALGLATPLPFSVLLNLMLTQWLIKVGYEVVATPLTYVIVGYLKRHDSSDVYDRHTNFSPVIFGQERETATVGAAES